MVAQAGFCKNCGAAIARPTLLRREPRFSPAAAAALSIVPGAGQAYRGKPVRGMLWFFGVLIAYGMGTPLGILMHMICASNAAFAGVAREDTIARAR